MKIKGLNATTAVTLCWVPSPAAIRVILSSSVYQKTWCRIYYGAVASDLSVDTAWPLQLLKPVTQVSKIVTNKLELFHVL
jgi:hypothetical protein